MSGIVASPIKREINPDHDLDFGHWVSFLEGGDTPSGLFPSAAARPELRIAPADSSIDKATHEELFPRSPFRGIWACETFVRFAD
jgi:hypothetical protein